MELTHGGDWAGYQQEYGGMPLDFSANVSPLGLPEGVRQAVVAALAEAPRYPDPLCRALRERLGALHGVPPAQVLCGNGAADLIFRLALAARPRRALVTAPTFAEYEQALELVGCNTRRWVLTPAEGFAVTERILPAINRELDVLFLCEPNNPTGRTTHRGLLQQILERCRECGVLLAVDECFNDFLDEPAAHSLIGELAHCQNLVIFRAFTKHYAMAGLRLGYCLGNRELLEQMARCGQPWGVSSLAQAAGLAALEEKAYSKTLRALIREERPFLAEGLAALGCQVFPGEANYLLFAHADREVCQKLRSKGVLLRDCQNYPGLAPGWYRAAVRTREENQALLRALREVL